MGITQTILETIRLPFTIRSVAVDDFVDGALPVPFEVDADAAVEGEVGEMDVEVRDAGLDDFG